MLRTPKLRSKEVQFERRYFDNRRYNAKENLVKRHVLEVLRWASKESSSNLLEGEGKTALDVGCGYGYSTMLLHLLGYRTCGLDLSKWGARKAKSIVDDDILVGDAQTFPFRDRVFDLIVCFDVLEHLQSPEKAIKNMFSMCDGTLICTTPNKLVEMPLRRLMRDCDETHINVHSPSYWERKILAVLKPRQFVIKPFLDLTFPISHQHVFFKSLRLPKFGLTVRILIKKLS